MRLNHIDLGTSDVPALASALEQHFGFRSVASGTVPAGAPRAGDRFAMLVGQDGAYVVVSQIPAQDGSPYPAPFHFGLMQDTADDVRAKHAELGAAGFAPTEVHEFEALGATWTAFFCPMGDGLRIEVNHRTASAQLDP